MNAPAAAIVGLAWLVFIIVWIFAALGAKRTARRVSWWRSAIFRWAAIIAIVVFLKQPGVEEFLSGIASPPFFANPIVSWIGAACAVAGIALSIWARAYLGRNWGMPMSLKESPELVTSGPYASIRHPIYAGVLLAILGSALVISYWWIVFVVSAAYFIYGARTEEKIMTREFPDQYPAYKARTKMLIPCIF